ncbi:MAG: hypothetical protein R2838_10305 [Caldilineaceae bacterium]
MSLNGGAYPSGAAAGVACSCPPSVLPLFLFTVFLTACSVFVALLIALTLDGTPVCPDAESSRWGWCPPAWSASRQIHFLRRLVAISVLTATFFSFGALFQPYLRVRPAGTPVPTRIGGGREQAWPCWCRSRCPQSARAGQADHADVECAPPRPGLSAHGDGGRHVALR